MNLLYIAQTTFYLTFSFLVIVIGILLILIAYNFWSLIRHLKRISANLENVSEEVKEKIIAIIERISELPPFSIFMKHHARKGRKNK